MARIGKLPRAGSMLVAAGIVPILAMPVGARPDQHMRPDQPTMSNQAAVAASHTETIQWIDAATGRLTRTWTRPAASASVTRHSPARPPSTDGTGRSIYRLDCSDPNPYWDVRNYPPLVCFANSGDLDVQIYHAYEVDSGNNTGWFRWLDTNGNEVTTTISDRWVTVIFSFRVTVTHIHIN